MKADGLIRVLRIVFLMLIVVFFCPFAYGKIIYVDDDGQVDFDNIQAAIDDCNDGDTVLVEPGIYTGDGNRDIDFKGKAITVKSEEGPETCIIDCQGTEEEQHRGFYFQSGEDANSVVQGFTIINGFVGDGGAIFCEGSSPTICECTIRSNTAQFQYPLDYEGSGGGIYCNYSEALIKDCIIIDNSANPRWLQVAIGGRGGGIYCSNSNLTITGCEISNNSSALDRSGAVYCWTSNITINTCISNDNQSNGIYMYRGNLEITDSLIANNKCSGIICREGNEAIVKNCDILKNRWDGLNFYNIEDILIERCLITANKHAGIFERGTNRLTVNNCTITNNRMRGIYCGAINCKISNSIIWENRILLSPSSIVDNPLCTISYSNVQGALESVGIVEGYSLNWGEGNINLDPNFASPGYWDPNGIGILWTYEDDIWVDGDYHLKSQAGRWDPNSQSWVVDDVTSPCIDAGDPNSPIGHEPFPNGGIINMGAYGGTEQASLSLSTAVANGVIIDQQLNAAGQGYTVVRLYGSYYEMGYAHGDLLADHIVRSVEETKELFGGLYTGMRTAMADSVWKPVEIEQELDGMVDALVERHPAAGIDKLDLKAYNAIGDLLYACRSHTCWGRYVAAPIKTLSTRRLDFPTPIGSLNHHVLFVYVPDDGSTQWVNLGFPGLVTSAQGLNEFGTLVSLHDYNSWGADISSGRMPRMIACRYALTYLPSSDLSRQLSDVFAELQKYEIMTGTFLNYYAPEGYGGVMTCNPNRNGPDFYNLRTPQNVWHHGEAMITTNQWTNGNYTPSDEDFGADVYYSDETPKTHESHWTLVDPVDSQDGLQRLSVAYRGKGDMTIWADGRIDGIGRTSRLEYEWSELFGPYEQDEATGFAELAEPLMLSAK